MFPSKYCDDWWYSLRVVLVSPPDNREEDYKKLKGLVDKSHGNLFISQISNGDFQVNIRYDLFFWVGKSFSFNSHFKDLFVLAVFWQAAEIWRSYDRALIQSKADLLKGEGGG